MPAQRQIGGIAYVKVDGKQLTLEGKLTVAITKVTREGKAGASGVAGYTETPRVPSIEGTFFKTAAVSIDELQAITDATVQVELNDGSIYVLRNAWQAGDIDVDAIAGTFDLKFEGMDGEEIRPAA